MIYPNISNYLLENPLSGSYTLGAVVFKPGYENKYLARFKEFCIVQELSLLKELPEMNLTKEFVIALYPKVFSFSDKDLQFGVEWKQLVIDYLTSAPVKIIIVTGKESTAKLNQFKYQLREENNKITNPKLVMTQKDFDEQVIKNLIHVIDEEELPNFLWLIK